MSTFLYSRSGWEFRSATPMTALDRCDLIDFLGVAQKSEIDFLPITWQPTLDHIGRGATAEIRETLINIQKSFAFKRPLLRSAFDIEELETRIFPSLIAEISVLGHSSIRGHPSIIQLEGICWEIFAEERQTLSREEPIDTTKSGIVPVLVFEKAKHGDLHEFMTQGAGRKLQLMERLHLCSEIARVVADMHGNNIIHGDIKPHNFLIFDNSSDGYTAKVADFGYSTQYATLNDLISMPRSKPWNAPEWHHRGFTPLQAKKMDVYSFGMMLVWLLCYCAQEHSDRRLEGDFITEPDHALAIAHTLIRSVPLLQKTSLTKLFNEALTSDPASRCSDFQYLHKLLTSEPTMPCLHLQRSLYGDVKWTSEFQVLPSIYQFYLMDYRVRLHIFKGLFERASALMSSSSFVFDFHNVLFQAAICCEIGFGTVRDETRSRRFLEKCDTFEDEFSHEIELFRNGGYYLTFENGLYKNMDRGAYLQRMNLTQQYRGQVDLERIEKEYRGEIMDAIDALDPDHRVVEILKGQLAMVFVRHGQWEKAEALQVEVLELKKRVLGAKHPSTLASVANLASTYGNQGWWKKAEELQVLELETRKQDWGADHPGTLRSMNNLAVTYTNQGRWEEAEELLLQVLETTKIKWGAEHAYTLTSTSNLALTYRDQKRFKEAEKLHTQVSNTSRRVLGVEHPDMLASMSNLALTYWDQERWEEAEGLQTQELETTGRVLGAEHPDTLNSASNLAFTFWAQGCNLDAVELMKGVVELRTRILGKDHPDTIRSIQMLEQWSQPR